MTVLVGQPADRCRDQSHHSYSSDTGFDECQYRDWHYRRGLAKRIASPRMAVGSAVDESIGVIVAGAMPDVPGIVTRIATEEGILRERIDEMTVDAIALVDLWVRESWPHWPELYAYQYELHWTIAGVVCHAHLDAVFMDGSVGDVKTSAKRITTNRADVDEQLTWYAWAMRSVFGSIPPRVFLDGLINGNPPADVKLWRPDAKKPWHDIQWSRRGPTELDALAEAVVRRHAVREHLDANGLHMTNGRSAPFACSDCPIRAECPAWSGYELVEVESAA